MEKTYERFGAKLTVKENVFGNSHIISRVSLDDEANLDDLYTLIFEYEKEEIENKSSKIYAKFVEDKVDIDFCHGVITAAGYSPIFLNGHYLEYDLEKIEKEKLLDFKKKLKHIYDNVLCDSQILATDYHRFYEKLKRIHNAPKPFTHQRSLNRYYKIGDEIVGYLGVMKNGDDGAIVYDSAVTKKETISIAYPGMIVSLLLFLKEAGKKEVSIMATTEGFYNGVITMFDNPDKDKLFFEYVKFL